VEKGEASLVSVIMPNFNNAKYISQAIGGIICQSWTNIELVIVDDGSTDGSQEVIGEWVAKDCRVHFIEHEKNKGVAAALNTGLKHAKGDYIGFCASDDVWKCDKVRLQVMCFRANPDVGVLHSDAEIIDEKGNKTGALFSNLTMNVRRVLSGNIFKCLLITNYISAPTVLIRKEYVERAGLFPESIKWLEDWVYMVRVAKHCLFMYMPVVLVQYRIHSGSSNRDTIGYEESRIKARLLMLKEISNINKPTRVFFYRQIGMGYMRLGQRKMAREWFAQALVPTPSFFKNAACWILSIFPLAVLKWLWKA
jgi:glycosyltransferase involved in cell wall biosynthesis